MAKSITTAHFFSALPSLFQPTTKKLRIAIAQWLIKPDYITPADVCFAPGVSLEDAVRKEKESALKKAVVELVNASTAKSFEDTTPEVFSKAIQLNKNLDDDTKTALLGILSQAGKVPSFYG